MNEFLTMNFKLKYKFLVSLLYKRLDYLLLIYGLSLALIGCNNSSNGKAAQPNIVFIMADDMGYSDLSCYGGEIKTPHIDKLAFQGVRFSRYYTSPMCITSRIAFLSGMEYMAAGGEGMPNGVPLAKRLRKAGYATHLVGKNHGLKNLRIGNPETDYGFDHFYGFSGGQMNSFTGAGHVEWQLDGNIFPNTDLPQDFYSTNYFTNYAIKFMGEAIEKDKPFFSFVAYNAPHTPLDAPERNVRKYYDPAKGINIYKEGWEKLRVKRLERLKAIGLLDSSVQLSSAGVEIPDWELLPDTAYNEWEMQKEFECLSRSAYAGMVDNIDENVGRIVEFLNDPNEDGNTDDSKLDNTIIIFVSDNGGCYAGLHTKRNALPWSKTNGGFTTNYGWGTLSNTPFRYYKHASHEGAIRSPFIIHWPSGLKLKPGSINNTMLRIWDFYPTFLELAESEYPTQNADLKPLMGKSFVPLIKNEPFEADTYFMSVYFRSRGIIKDGWKMVNYYDGPLELYNLKADPTEKNDLVKAEPERLAKFKDEWNSYSKLHGFDKNQEYNRHIGDIKRGWGYDFLPKGVLKTSPICMSSNVDPNTKLSITFDGVISFSDTQGREIRLQKYGDPRILWSADPDEKSEFQGKSNIIFNNFPQLEPNSHYYITWDEGWVKFKSGNHYRRIGPSQESAYAFRFKTN